jgi:cytochrome d ubiquinol oxidase subunit II
MTLDYETLKVIWWLFIGVLLIGFAIMDGFDMGIGILLPFIGKTDEERRVLLNVIGPTWESNQVWFVTAGGALFAAWPLVYATAFSGFYFALLLVLFALFLRPVGFDYRSKLANPIWRKAWDWGLFIGGAVPALVFGIAFGNLLLGVPFHFDSDLRSYYTGSFWDLLNPFGIMAGLLSVAMLTMHGAVYLQKRTVDIISKRCQQTVQWSALIFCLLFATGGVWIASGIDGYHIVSMGAFDAAPNPLHKTVQTSSGAWLNNYTKFSWLFLIPTTVFVMTFFTVMFSRLNKPGLAFIASSVSVAGVILTAGFSMFPFLLPSSSDPNSSLTVWDASSSYMTLKVMFWATVIFLPIVIIYTNWVYRVLKGKITVETIRDNQHTAY